MEKEIVNSISNLPESKHLYEDVCHIIDDTRTRVAVYVNSEVCMTNWRIGTRIKEDVLYNKRAEYGKQVIKNLSLKLSERYGKGWSEKTLRHCLRSAETFSEADILSAVRRQFSWTQLKSVMYLSDPLARQWYEKESAQETWSVKTLQRNISSQYYYRILQSPQPQRVEEEMQKEIYQMQHNQQ